MGNDGTKPPGKEAAMTTDWRADAEKRRRFDDYFIDLTPDIDDARLSWDARRLRLDAARCEAARRNAIQFGTDPSWYGR